MGRATEKRIAAVTKRPKIIPITDVTMPVMAKPLLPELLLIKPRMSPGPAKRKVNGPVQAAGMLMIPRTMEAIAFPEATGASLVSWSRSFMARF
jgi:hypothetical protein